MVAYTSSIDRQIDGCVANHCRTVSIHTARWANTPRQTRGAEMRARQIFPGVIAIVVSAVSPALGATVGVVVTGSANPYLSGMPSGSACCASGGAPDLAPAQSPVQVLG